MARLRNILIAAILLATPAALAADEGVYTLYRNSVTDITMRIHISTYDTAEGAKYKLENCQIAADLFEHQPGVQVKYWCEPGRYHK